MGGIVGGGAVINPIRYAIPTAPAAPAGGTCASFYQRIQNRRWIGFFPFITNKAFAVSDGVPEGHLWLLFALSAFHTSSLQRVIHLFAVPPAEATNLFNPNADVASPHFLGALNNPPLRSGVLMSVGGSSQLPDMQSVSNSSVNGLVLPFYLPARWKILACIDSNEAVITAPGDGITIDAVMVDVTDDEEIPAL